MREKLGRLAALGAGLGLALGLALTALAAPAVATETDNAVCATWKIQGATGTYPDIEFGDAPEGSSVINAHKVELTKPQTGDMPGVEFAAKDVDYLAEAEVQVTVEYELTDGATPAAGAVRLFGYADQDANTVNDGPDWQDEADSTSGALSFTVPAEGKIGTLGLVYDASNDSDGLVTFRNLKVGDRLVSFTTCPEPTTEPTTEPTGEPTEGPTANPTKPAGPSKPAGRPGESRSALPVTGSGGGTNWPLVIGGVGGGILAAGLAMMFLARRRRFEA